MFRTYLLAILIVFLVVTAVAQAAADEVLPAGTLLQCTLDEPNFSSRTGQIGDPSALPSRCGGSFWAFVVSPGRLPGRSFPGLSRPWTLLWQRVDRAGV